VVVVILWRMPPKLEKVPALQMKKRRDAGRIREGKTVEQILAEFGDVVT
jgi:hypothetical protein